MSTRVPTQRWSTEQREAIIAAVLDQDLTVKDALEAARAGELGDPFDMPLKTAHSYVTKARKRRRDAELQAERERMTPLEYSEDFVRRALALAGKSIERVEQLDPLDPKRIQAMPSVMKAARMADLLTARREARAAEQAEDAQRQRPTPSTPATAEEPNDFAAQLAAQARDPQAAGETPGAEHEWPEDPTPSVVARAERHRRAAHQASDERLQAAQAILAPLQLVGQAQKINEQVAED